MRQRCQPLDNIHKRETFLSHRSHTLGPGLWKPALEQLKFSSQRLIRTPKHPREDFCSEESAKPRGNTKILKLHYASPLSLENPVRNLELPTKRFVWFRKRHQDGTRHKLVLELSRLIPILILSSSRSRNSPHLDFFGTLSMNELDQEPGRGGNGTNGH